MLVVTKLPLHVRPTVLARPPTSTAPRVPTPRDNEPTFGEMLHISRVKGDLYNFREELRLREFGKVPSQSSGTSSKSRLATSSGVGQ